MALAATVLTAGEQDAHAAVDCTAVADGEWTDKSTWDCELDLTVVASGMTVQIPAGITVDVPAGETVQVQGIARISGTVEIPVSATLLDTGLIRVQPPGTLDNGGLLTVAAGGTLANRGTVENQTGAVVANSGLFTNEELFTNASGAAVDTLGGTFENDGQVDNEGGFTTSGGGQISNLVDAEIASVGAAAELGNGEGCIVSNEGTISSNLAANVNNLGSFTNDGEVLNLNESVFFNDPIGTVINRGYFENSAAALVQTQGLFRAEGEAMFLNWGTATRLEIHEEGKMEQYGSSALLNTDDAVIHLTPDAKFHNVGGDLYNRLGAIVFNNGQLANNGAGSYIENGTGGAVITAVGGISNSVNSDILNESFMRFRCDTTLVNNGTFENNNTILVDNLLDNFTLVGGVSGNALINLFYPSC